VTLGRTLDAFAVTAPGLASLAAHELTAMGIAPTATEAAGVSFSANAAQLAAAQLGLRTVSRVLVRMATFRATAFHELERAARQVEWDEVLPAGAPFTLRVTCRKSRLYHSDAVAERVAGAIVRAIPGSSWQRGADASDETDEETPTSHAPAQLFVVRFDRDRCTISASRARRCARRSPPRCSSGLNITQRARSSTRCAARGQLRSRRR